MTDSVFTGSVVVEGEVPAGCVDLACLPEQPAVPDAVGEGEHALADPGPGPFGDVAAVVLEGELALGCLVGRLDPLADAAELSEARPLVLAVRADECRVKAGDDLLELPGAQRILAVAGSLGPAWRLSPLTNGVSAVGGGVLKGGSARPVSVPRARCAPSRRADASPPAA